MKNLRAFAKKIAEIINKDVDIVEKTGYVVSSSDDSRVGTVVAEFNHETSMPLDEMCRCYVSIEGGSDEEISLAALILKYMSDKGTVDNYRQFLINILEGYGYGEEYCERFGIGEGSFVIYCITLHSNQNFSDAYNLIYNSFYGEEGIWIFPYEFDIILLKKVSILEEPVKPNAKTIKDMVNSEVYADAYVGVGGIHSGIEGIRKSFLEAKEAIEVGRLFDIPESIYIYKDMLPERIISMIPEEKLQELKAQVLEHIGDEAFDSEMMRTIEVLFKNNLNISDSSKILYIHRNTLLYRLDKIQKVTGLDIKKFEDAVVLKLLISLKVRLKKCK